MLKVFMRNEKEKGMSLRCRVDGVRCRVVTAWIVAHCLERFIVKICGKPGIMDGFGTGTIAYRPSSVCI